MKCEFCQAGHPRILGRHLRATRGGQVDDLGACQAPNVPEERTPDAKAEAAREKLHAIASRITTAAVLEQARVAQYMTRSQPREPGEDDDAP